MATILSTSTSYDNALAQLLAGICQSTTDQYNAPPDNNGQIEAPVGYHQTATFTAAEVETDKVASRLFAARPELKSLVHQVHKEAASAVRENTPAYMQFRTQFETVLKDPATIDALTAATSTVYIGFALEPDPASPRPAESNVIALRGSESDFEWDEDTKVLQVAPPEEQFGTLLPLSLAHVGFITVFGLIFDQIKDAVSKFADPSLPLYITGHSLGGALATLASLSAVKKMGAKSVTMYTFAGPRVGNWSFATSFDADVKSAFRVVNLADAVPVSPPPQLDLLNYEHVGEEWSFLNQTQDPGKNHSLKDGYIPALSLHVETNAKRTYPNSGIPCDQVG